MNQIEKDYNMLLNKLQNNEPFAFSHYNHGEVEFMGYRNINYGKKGFPPTTKNLLRQIFLMNIENFFVGLPCKFHHPLQYKFAIELMNQHKIQRYNLQSMVFHHNYHDRSKFFNILKNKKIVWIVPELFGYDRLLETLKLKKENNKIITVSNKNVWANDFEKLKDLTFDSGDVVIILCGTLARVLAGIYFNNNKSTTFLCLGSYFDSISQHRKIHRTSEYFVDSNDEYYASCLNTMNWHGKCDYCFPWKLKKISNKNFSCDKCDFHCNKKHYFDLHMATKHNNKIK